MVTKRLIISIWNIVDCFRIMLFNYNFKHRLLAFMAFGWHLCMGILGIPQAFFRFKRFHGLKNVEKHWIAQKNANKWATFQSCSNVLINYLPFNFQNFFLQEEMEAESNCRSLVVSTYTKIRRKETRQDHFLIFFIKVAIPQGIGLKCICIKSHISIIK